MKKMTFHDRKLNHKLRKKKLILEKSLQLISQIYWTLTSEKKLKKLQKARNKKLEKFINAKKKEKSSSEVLIEI